jgi:hypothetical protein
VDIPRKEARTIRARRHAALYIDKAGKQMCALLRSKPMALFCVYRQSGHLAGDSRKKKQESNNTLVENSVLVRSRVQ